MKKYIIYYFLKQLSVFPKLKKKIRIFAAIASVFVILTGSFLVWGAYTVITTLANTATAVAQEAKIQDAPNLLRQKVQNFYQNNLEQCVSSATGLMDFEKLITGQGFILVRDVVSKCFILERKNNCAIEECSKQQPATQEKFI